MMARMNIGRRAATAAVAALAVLAAAGTGIAGHGGSNVKSYTGCLSVNGGTFTQIKEGDAPHKACGAGQVEAHVAGGDITAVNVGTGLTGGGTNGAVTIGLNAQQSLPSCTSGQVPKWSGSAWSCGADNDTQYSAGTGLDLSGTTFSIEPDNLVSNNQSCTGGQFATGINGSGALTCGSPAAGTKVYANTQSTGVGIPDDLTPTQVVTLSVPAGAYSITAIGEMEGPFSDGAELSCSLFAGSTFLAHGTGHKPDNGSVDKDSIAMMGLRAFSGATTLRVTCDTNDDGVSANGFGIQAISVE